MDIRLTENYRKYEEAKQFIEEFEKAKNKILRDTRFTSDQMELLFLKEEIAGFQELAKQNILSSIYESRIQLRRILVKNLLKKIYKPNPNNYVE